MSKPSLYLPSEPVKYELKRQLIPTDVLIGPVTSFVFYFFIKNPMDRIGDWILLTILVNIFTAAILSGIWYTFIEMPWRLRRQQKIFDEKKYTQNLNNFITECRKLK
ncbi:hypothetical protein [Escherichia phage vB_EcoM-UFV05]|nr:hypothetical protein [Escherichia phage vB_EcoM-UFV09]UYE93098.1 hypothetical protein [Escherichia phage vB_EcoM-UFV05]UYL83991.1 hypothetical protein [Escherichia phage vB_EcoM-UFV06]UYL84277.1 hypothetical protein [Escherichia phage vB_EcoM-UFV10]UYL84563.1 hypothetical protein [Escherichia phage vB_EcoM-UFV11]